MSHFRLAGRTEQVAGIALMKLLVDGLMLMVLGMGTVFLFLGIMVAWIGFSSRILARFSHLLPDQEPAPARKPQAKKALATGREDDATLVAVVSAAISRYRADRG